MLYKNLRIIYFLERFFKYNFKNPLFWFVIIDWFLTKIIIGSGKGFEYNPIVDYFGNDFSLLISIVLVSLIPKGYIRWVLIARYCFIISRHLLILFGII